jgi:hypothetical protein
MAGYSQTSLIKKLGIQENSRIAFVNAPENFHHELGALPTGAIILSQIRQPIDCAMIFVKSEARLRKDFAKFVAKLSPAGMLWVAWPKKSSRISTDLRFEVVQAVGLEAGLVDTKICAIDDIWSGLRFVMRMKNRSRHDE